MVEGAIEDLLELAGVGSEARVLRGAMFAFCWYPEGTTLERIDELEIAWSGPVNSDDETFEYPRFLLHPHLHLEASGANEKLIWSDISETRERVRKERADVAL